MAQGNGLNILQRLSNIEAELERICAVLAGFEQAHQVQKKRIEELERVLNTLRGSQPEVSTAPTGHERGQMGDDVSMASNAHESDASMNDLRMGSPNNNVGDGSNIFDASVFKSAWRTLLLTVPLAHSNQEVTRGLLKLRRRAHKWEEMIPLMSLLHLLRSMMACECLLL
jgi:hypothetical protein